MKLLADMLEKKWIFEEEQLPTHHIFLSFGFIDSSQFPIFFNNMKFGYSLKLQNKVIAEDSRPEPNQQYISTDQEVIESFSVYELLPDRQYVLNVWAENNGESWSDSFSFTLPKPKQPYPSWTFDEEYGVWNPPVPYPNKEGYVWDEDEKNWVEYTPQ